MGIYGLYLRRARDLLVRKRQINCPKRSLASFDGSDHIPSIRKNIKFRPNLFSPVHFGVGVKPLSIAVGDVKSLAVVTSVSVNPAGSCVKSTRGSSGSIGAGTRRGYSD